MKKFKKYLTPKNILLLTCVIVFCVSAGLLLQKYVQEKGAQKYYESLSGTSTQNEPVNGTEDVLSKDIFMYLGIENPNKVLDWEYLWEQNEDIYAWIYIPDTNIDYPILQHETDDTYYLEYNLDGTKGYPGCIYTEKINAKDFSDHNTLIYGHNMKNGTMFHDLHNFADETFFAEHRYIFIYMPEKVLVYDIYGAYKFTNAHILYNYDCNSEEGFASYLELIESNYGTQGNFRDGVEVTGSDHIITLSTCVGGEDDKRYLVQGVLVEYEIEE
ncbi:MAG: class B sortase [Agathobacter sp.]|nr:class B sortase [Agathobacter sp.]